MCTFCAQIGAVIHVCAFRGDPALEAIDSTDAPALLVTTHRRESWGQQMRHVAGTVAGLTRTHPDLIVVLPLHPNPVVREALLPALDGLDNVMLVEPMGYAAFARLLQRSTIVLTDSGGVQEEAPSLDKPVLVMRDTTERLEAVSAARPGWSAPILTACTPRSTNYSPVRGPIRRWPTPSTPTATAEPRSGLQKPSNTCSALAVGQSPLARAPPGNYAPGGRMAPRSAETTRRVPGGRWPWPYLPRFSDQAGVRGTADAGLARGPGAGRHGGERGPYAFRADSATDLTAVRTGPGRLQETDNQRRGRPAQSTEAEMIHWWVYIPMAVFLAFSAAMWLLVIKHAETGTDARSAEPLIPARAAAAARDAQGPAASERRAA